MRIIGTTLHVNVIRLQERNELNLILLATSLRVVNEVRIHNFQINFYLTARKQHIRLTKAHWRVVGFFLPYVNQGPWVESEGKREGAMKITFDEFLRPTIEAWRAGLPYAELIYGLPQSEIELIAAGKKLTHIHADLSA